MKQPTDINDNCNDSETNCKVYTCDMVIDIIDESILRGLPVSGKHNNVEWDNDAILRNISFQSIIEQYTLDFKQSVAFEIMASSFILKSLSEHSDSRSN